MTNKKFEGFCTLIEDNILDYLPEEYQNASVTVRKVQKNNNLILTGIVVMKEDDKIAPTVYLDNYYPQFLNGMRLEDILRKVANTIVSCEMPADCQNISETFQNFEFVKDKIIFVLVNAEKNKTLLENVPYTQYLDFAIIYKVMVGGVDDGIGTVTITNEHLKCWNKTLADLDALASQNTPKLFPAKTQNMLGMFRELIEQFDDEVNLLPAAPTTMIVVGNRRNINGAGVILYKDVLSEIANEFDDDLYILPSSIHETIVLSVTGKDINELTQMVREVNCEAVADEEILSNNVYRYDRETNSITLTIKED